MTKQRSDVEMTFWDHLEELRWVFIRSLLGIAVFSIVAFIFKEFVFDRVFLAPKEPEFLTNALMCKLAKQLNTAALCLNDSPLEIINIKLAGQFTTHLLISFASGLFLASPYVIFEFWRFVRPALYTKERKHSRGAVLVCSLLFIIGVLFAYFLILPLTINFLGSYHVSASVANTISLGSYIRNVISVTLSLGIVFEIPVLVFFLTKTGLITPAFMKKHRKIVFVILLILSAIITPPDLISQIMVVIPLLMLYEISIWISHRVYKKAQKAQK